MSEKRYDTNAEKKEILQGLEFFVSSENPDLINPKEIKDLMDKLELKDKMPFVYELIDELSSSREIKRNGGITKDDFIAFLEDKMNDQESKEGIQTIYNVFVDSGNDDSVAMTNFCRAARDVGDADEDQELKELLEKAEMTGKELNFDEFYEIMKNDDENKNIIRKKRPSDQGVGYNNKLKQDRKKNKNKNNSSPYYEPGEEVEKKIVVTEIITTGEKYKNKYNKDKDNNSDDNEGNTYTITKKVFTTKVEGEDNNEPEQENNNNNDNEGSDSKRYHRRYRASCPTVRPGEQKTETTVTYNRYRRKI